MATRNERVVLTLEDDFSTKMARAAATTAALNRELNNLSGNAVSARGVSRASADVEKLGKNASSSERQIDKLSGRVRILADVAAMLGPAFVPLGGVALAGIAGLASQMGFAALAAGVMAGSLQGVGDALEAVNKAGLEPTAENIEAAKIAMEAISPEARKFVRELHDMIPALKAVRDAGAEAAFPGLTDSLDDLERVLPKVEQIFSSIGGAIGDIAENSAESFASSRWGPFLKFIRDEAPSALTDLASIVGDLGHGLARLWMDFDPLNDDFSTWLVGVAAGFDEWAKGLSETQGFADFMDYVRTTGPQVAETLGALGNALVQIVQAAAPVGGPVLVALEAVADAIAAIAGSDIGTPLVGLAVIMATLSRATSLYGVASRTAFGARAVSSVKGMGTALVTVTSAQDRARLSSAALARVEAQRTSAIRGGMATLGKSAALVGGLALAGTGAADGLGLANTASLALLGSLAGPVGAGLGATAGLFLDTTAAADDFTASIDALNDATMSGDLRALDEQIANVQARLKDAKSTTGVGDFFSDFYAAGSLNPIENYTTSLEGARLARERFANTSIDPNATNLGGLLGQPLQLGKEFDVATRSATDFRNSMLSLNDALTGRSSWRDYEAAIDAVTAGLKENGRTLDITTEKGRANQTNLDNIAATSISVAENLKGMDRVRFLQRARKDFVDAAVDLGRTRKGARDLANDLGLLNTKNAKPEIDADDKKFKGKLRGVNALMNAMNDDEAKPEIDADDSPFKAAYNDVNAMLAALDGKTATTYVRTVTTGGKGPQPALENARGNYLDKANMHQPQIAKGGLTRVWAEPETQGETYIPHANDWRRPRAKSLLQQTARKFGGDVQWFAGGGSVGNADERLAVLQAEQRIRDILKALNADGKDKLSKNAREIAKVELEAAKVALRAAKKDLGGTARDKAADAAEAAAEARDKAEQDAADAWQRQEDDVRARMDAYLDGQERAVNQLLSAAEEQKSAATVIRDSVKQNMDRLGEAATSGFRSGLFESSSGNLFAGSSGSGWRGALDKDIAGLTQRSGIIKALSDAGLSGTAIDALLSQGNNRQLQAFIDSGSASEFAAKFAQRESLLSSVGQEAGVAAYGSELSSANATLASIDARIADLNGRLLAIAAQRPMNVYETLSAQETAREIARIQGLVVI